MLRRPPGATRTVSRLPYTSLFRSAHSLDSAILLNGTLVRYLDFMDVYWSRDICHPSENIPVALAAAQAAHCSGRELIEAIAAARSEEHTSELQSLMRRSYAVFCLQKKQTTMKHTNKSPRNRL